MEQPRRILVIRLGGMGNVIFALPAIYALKHWYPQAKITLLTYSNHTPIAEMGGVDHWLALDRPRQLKHWATMAPRHLKLLHQLFHQRFSLTIDLQSFGETALFSLLAASRRRGGLLRHSWQKACYHFYHPSRPRIPGEHQVQEFLRVLRPLGSVDLSLPPKLAPLPQYQLLWQKKLGTQRPWVGLNIGASHPQKRMSIEKWNSIAQWCLFRDWGVVVMVGPQEKIAAKQWRKKLPTSPHLVWSPPSGLYDLAGLVANLDAFISADTGPLHLASAVGIPVIGLFREGYHQRYAPLSPSPTVLFRPSIEEIPLEEIYLALEKVIPYPVETASSSWQTSPP